MSKYELLSKYIDASKSDMLNLSFQEIEKILGFQIDHSFLSYKKELLVHGWEVSKISIKNRFVIFRKINNC